ncbi:MAG TPA: SGNH/GDSL hydrolase family protein [bacterium]|nr:SGNH/GDSL hydrolase family protein [bacterium]HOL46923.1 SGNH/GDSL hydrolase family protein [bacterium]HPQ18315.1 SGNH/GDSL hydrolase family protein [bacterium]
MFLKKIFIHFFLIIFAIFFSLFFLECILRILWYSRPDNYISIYTPFYQLSNNKNLIYEHIPNWSGFATGTKIRINNIGLRNIEISEKKEKKRILLIGDSMIFGFGLKDKFLISSQLENLLKKNGFNNFEVINAGVCGYNLRQNFENLKKYYYLLKPDFVLISFIHNDIDDLFNNNEIIFPSFTSTYFTDFNRNTFLFKLYNFFINEDILKHKRYSQKGIKNFFINNSALYLFIALKLKLLVLQNSGYETTNPYLKYFPDSFAFKKIVLDNINQILKEFSEFQHQEKFNYAFVILNNYFFNSYIELKITELLEANKIKYLNFSPFLPDFFNYYKNYTLRWDSHPDKKGALLYAQLFFDSLNFFDFISSNQKYFFDKDNYFMKIYQHLQKLEKKLERINLKQNINFENNEELNNYPVWGFYHNLQFSKKYSGKILSKYFSVFLENNNCSEFYLIGEKIFSDNSDLIININNNIFKYKIETNNFICKIPITNITDKKIEIFVETENPIKYNNYLISFVIKEIGLK